MRRGSYDIGSTSDGFGGSLTTDDGAGRDIGSISSDHAISREYNAGRRGSGFEKNPEADFGITDSATGRNQIDVNTGQKWPAGAGYTKQGDPRGPTWSAARAKASCAVECLIDEWEGTNESRES
jgi:hypothetical protein